MLFEFQHFGEPTGLQTMSTSLHARAGSAGGRPQHDARVHRNSSAGMELSLPRKKLVIQLLKILGRVACNKTEQILRSSAGVTTNVPSFLTQKALWGERCAGTAPRSRGRAGPSAAEVPRDVIPATGRRTFPRGLKAPTSAGRRKNEEKPRDAEENKIA